MKLILFVLLASATMMSGAYAVSATHEECTTTSNNSEVPSGTYVAPDGRHWAGFKPDGSPPDSLTSSGGVTTTCVTVQDVS